MVIAKGSSLTFGRPTATVWEATCGGMLRWLRVESRVRLRLGASVNRRRRGLRALLFLEEPDGLEMFLGLPQLFFCFSQLQPCLLPFRRHTLHSLFECSFPGLDHFDHCRHPVRSSALGLGFVPFLARVLWGTRGAPEGRSRSIRCRRMSHVPLVRVTARFLCFSRTVWVFVSVSCRGTRRRFRVPSSAARARAPACTRARVSAAD